MEFNKEEKLKKMLDDFLNSEYFEYLLVENLKSYYKICDSEETKNALWEVIKSYTLHGYHKKIAAELGIEEG